MNRSSSVEWSGSASRRACSSVKTVDASSKETPCFLLFSASFAGSHSIFGCFIITLYVQWHYRAIVFSPAFNVQLTLELSCLARACRKQDAEMQASDKSAAASCYAPGSGTSRSRKIFRARKLLISLWRGTVDVLRVVRLTYLLLLPPSLIYSHPL